MRVVSGSMTASTVSEGGGVERVCLCAECVSVRVVSGSMTASTVSEGGGVDVLADHSMFHRVQYLGAASINAPRSEPEIQRNMAILNAEETGRQAIAVCVAVPTTPEGSVV